MDGIPFYDDSFIVVDGAIGADSSCCCDAGDPCCSCAVYPPSPTSATVTPPFVNPALVVTVTDYTLSRRSFCSGDVINVAFKVNFANLSPLSPLAFFTVRFLVRTIPEVLLSGDGGESPGYYRPFNVSPPPPGVQILYPEGATPCEGGVTEITWTFNDERTADFSLDFSLDLEVIYTSAGVTIPPPGDRVGFLVNVGADGDFWSYYRQVSHRLCDEPDEPCCDKSIYVCIAGVSQVLSVNGGTHTWDVSTCCGCETSATLQITLSCTNNPSVVTVTWLYTCGGVTDSGSFTLNDICSDAADVTYINQIAVAGCSFSDSFSNVSVACEECVEPDPGVPTDCCPDPLPTNLCVTWSGGTQTIVWDGSAWRGGDWDMSCIGNATTDFYLQFGQSFAASLENVVCAPFSGSVDGSIAGLGMVTVTAGAC